MRGWQSSAIKNVIDTGEREVTHEEERSEKDQETIILNCTPENNAICCGYTSLKALRKVLKDGTVIFMESASRRGYASCICKTQRQALVLSTGFGKTDIVCGPILYEEGFTTWGVASEGVAEGDATSVEIFLN